MGSPNPSEVEAREYFKYIRYAASLLPGDHPIHLIYGNIPQKQSSQSLREIGYERGVWMVFVPTRLLYIELQPLFVFLPQWKKSFRERFLPFGFRFYDTTNWASAALLTLKELGVDNPMLLRDLTSIEAQINGVQLLLKRQRRLEGQRRAKRSLRERLLEKE